MNTKEAFTLGFLGRLAERGVTPKQFEKQGSIGEVISSLPPIALAALIGVPAAAGILTGWGHAGMSDVTDEDIERMKLKDRASTYRSETQRIRRKLRRSAWKSPATNQRSPAAEF